MKMDWLVTFRSVTFAQRGQRVLERVGIRSALRRTPRELSRRGCGYCLAVDARTALAAAQLLREQEIPFERIYAPGLGGAMEEREL